jgi:hypothetical protein
MKRTMRGVRRQLRQRYWFSEGEIEALALRSMEDGKRYISQRAYQALRPWLDDPAWNEVLRNKWLTRQFFEAHQLPYPTSLGYLSPTCGGGFGLWQGRSLRSGSDLMRAVEHSREQAIVLKHVTSGVGNGVFICEWDGTALCLRSGETLSAARIDALLQASTDGFLVERSVTACPELRAAIGERLHSVRVQTFRRRDGDAIFHIAYLRVGQRAALTDHASVGGMMFPVDVDSGTVGRAVDGGGSHDRFQGNATGDDAMRLRLEGRTLPSWERLRRVTLEAARALPRVRWVGWDVIVEPDGPVLIEGNVGNPMVLYQRIAGPLREIGVLTDWAQEWGAPLPDGSLRWRLAHRYTGRRLSAWEQLAAALFARISGRRF